MTSESAGTHDQTPAERWTALDARRAPEGYDVAPLEWERVNDYRHYAKCVIGYYDVRDSLVSPGQWFFELNDRSADPLLFPTLDEAKAAAEADYRQRILSALRPRQGTAPAVGGDWQRDAFDATLALAINRPGNWPAREGLTLAHLQDMRRRVTPDFSPSKLDRWLGWAQACVVAAGCATLGEMKAINEAASEAAGETDDAPPIPAPARVETVEARETARLIDLLEGTIAAWEAAKDGRVNLVNSPSSALTLRRVIAALRSSEGRGTGWQIVPAHVTAGDYAYDGWDIGHVTKRSGQVRAVVEDENGRLFIHRPEQVAAAPSKSSVTG